MNGTWTKGTLDVEGGRENSEGGKENYKGGRENSEGGRENSESGRENFQRGRENAAIDEVHWAEHQVYLGVDCLDKDGPIPQVSVLLL